MCGFGALAGEGFVFLLRCTGEICAAQETLRFIRSHDVGGPLY